MQKFIRVRSTGDVYYHTDALERRDDVDVIEGSDTDTPDTVLSTLNAAREQLRAQAQAEAEQVARQAQKEAEKKAADAKKAADKTAPPPSAPAGLSVER